MFIIWAWRVIQADIETSEDGLNSSSTAFGVSYDSRRNYGTRIKIHYRK